MAPATATSVVAGAGRVLVGIDTEWGDAADRGELSTAPPPPLQPQMPPAGGAPLQQPSPFAGSSVPQPRFGEA